MGRTSIATLFERLRAVRLEIARSRGVPPYVIFHDATLREMARLRPTSMDALLAVKGVGARKADDLGETFLAAIRGARGLGWRHGGRCLRHSLQPLAQMFGKRPIQMFPVTVPSSYAMRSPRGDQAG